MSKLKVNSSHLNDQVMINILNSCANALKNGSASVLNKKGSAYLTIKKVIVNNKVYFKIFDQSGANIRKSLGLNFIIKKNVINNLGLVSFISDRVLFN